MTFDLSPSQCSSQSQSQGISQVFPNAQKDLTSKICTINDLANAKETFIGYLTAKNNAEYEDEGVHLIIEALNSDNPIKTLKYGKKKVYKHHLIVVLVFFMGPTLTKPISDLRILKLKN